MDVKELIALHPSKRRVREVIWSDPKAKTLILSAIGVAAMGLYLLGWVTFWMLSTEGPATLYSSDNGLTDIGDKLLVYSIAGVVCIAGAGALIARLKDMKIFSRAVESWYATYREAQPIEGSTPSEIVLLNHAIHYNGTKPGLQALVHFSSDKRLYQDIVPVRYVKGLEAPKLVGDFLPREMLEANLWDKWAQQHVGARLELPVPSKETPKKPVNLDKSEDQTEEEDLD